MNTVTKQMAQPLQQAPRHVQQILRLWSEAGALQPPVLITVAT